MNYSTSFLDLCSCALGGLLLLMFLLVPQTKQKYRETGGIKPALMIQCVYPVYHNDNGTYPQAKIFPFTVEEIKKVSIKLSNGQTYNFSNASGVLWDCKNNSNPAPLRLLDDDGLDCTLTFSYKPPGTSTGIIDSGSISVCAMIDIPEEIEKLDAIMVVSSKNKKTYSEKTVENIDIGGNYAFFKRDDYVLWVYMRNDYTSFNKDNVEIGRTSNYNFYSNVLVFSPEKNIEEETTNGAATNINSNTTNTTSSIKFGLDCGLIGNEYGTVYSVPEKGEKNINKKDIDNPDLLDFYKSFCNSGNSVKSNNPVDFLGNTSFSYVKLINDNEVIKIDNSVFVMPFTESDL